MPGMRRFLIFAIVLFIVCCSTAEAGFLRISHMTLDPNRWGERSLTIPIENPVDDTARINVSLTTAYPNHYLSCVDEIEFDTVLVIPPKFNGQEDVKFYIDGSFGRAKISFLAKWKHDGDADTVGYDSTVQTFSVSFDARGPAEGLDDYRYGLGAMHSVWFDRNFDYEYPRLLLYLISRDKSVEEVHNMFYPSLDYTRKLAEHFQARGLIPENSTDAVKTFLAISENEGFAIRPEIMKFSEEFIQWYESKGSKNLDKYLREAGIDSAAAAIPALRMTVLYSLLMESWLAENAREWHAFENSPEDINIWNRPRWLVQGGAFFQPRLCMASFDDDVPGEILLGAFVPDYSLACMRLSLVFMHQRAEKDLSIRDAAIATITAADAKAALDKARDKKLTKEAQKMLTDVIENTATHLPYYNDAMKPALADYICRIALASCFVDEPQFTLDKFVAVRY
ncbi:MAG: hypothetical protein R3F48_08675 [Candidatus Zixiibacteriota bacterium]